MSTDLTTVITTLLREHEKPLSARELVKLLPAALKGTGAKGRVNAILYSGLKAGTLCNELRDGTPVWRVAGADVAGTGADAAEVEADIAGVTHAPPTAIEEPRRRIVFADCTDRSPLEDWMHENGYVVKDSFTVVMGDDVLLERLDERTTIRYYIPDTDEHAVVRLARDYMEARRLGYEAVLHTRNPSLRLLEEPITL